ncbi:hypothetical protein GJAV_G00182110 [Gymnothorax javanicus]|nr:hypothetical protein GJAV_G00182110 [Gymnothorax javanicus]
MGETVLYSSVTFKKDLRRETPVTQDEDVTYAEVRSSNRTSSDTVCPSAAAEGSVGSSHPYRLAAVCLGLLCALLLTATLVLCVLYTSRSQTYSLLERDREELRASKSTMIQERDQLQRDNTILKTERDQLETNYTRLKTERDQLQRNYTILKKERDQLETNYIRLNEERNRQETNYTRLKTESHQLQRDYTIFKQAVLKRECKPCPQGWEQFGSKCYFFSTESKNWTESRIDCIKRGADLVIIESKEEQDFISRHYYYYYYNYNYYDHWIGLSDTVTEGTWLWVDGSRLQGGFWGSGQPNDQYRYRGTDCAYNAQREKTWMDTNCNQPHRFICETDALLPLRILHSQVM